jgi:hypothetical protein
LPLGLTHGMASFQLSFLIDGFGFGAQQLLFDGFERFLGDFLLDAVGVGVRAFAVAGAVCVACWHVGWCWLGFGLDGWMDGCFFGGG